MNLFFPLETVSKTYYQRLVGSLLLLTYMDEAIQAYFSILLWDQVGAM